MYLGDPVTPLPGSILEKTLVVCIKSHVDGHSSQQDSFWRKTGKARISAIGE